MRYVPFQVGHVSKVSFTSTVILGYTQLCSLRRDSVKLKPSIAQSGPQTST